MRPPESSRLCDPHRVHAYNRIDVGHVIAHSVPIIQPHNDSSACGTIAFARPGCGCAVPDSGWRRRPVGSTVNAAGAIMQPTRQPWNRGLAVQHPQRLRLRVGSDLISHRENQLLQLPTSTRCAHTGWYQLLLQHLIGVDAPTLVDSPLQTEPVRVPHRIYSDKSDSFVPL